MATIGILYVKRAKGERTISLVSWSPFEASKALKKMPASYTVRKSTGWARFFNRKYYRVDVIYNPENDPSFKPEYYRNVIQVRHYLRALGLSYDEIRKIEKQEVTGNENRRLENLGTASD